MSEPRPPLEALLQNDVFAAFPAGDLAPLSPHLAWSELEASARLFTEGDKANDVYVLISGALDVLVRDKQATVRVGEVRPGEMVGEMQLLFGGVRAASIVAREPSRLVVIPNAALDQLDRAALAERLSGLVLRRLRQNQLAESLRTLFGALDDATLRALERAATWVNLRRGDVLFKAGETSDGLYVVVTGRLRAYAVDGGGRETALSEIGGGECVGEMALITGEPRMATVRALRDCDLVQFDKPAVDAFLRSHPDALMHITKLVVRRYQSSLGAAPARPRASSIALLPLSQDRGVIAQFTAALAQALAAHGSVIYVTSAAVDGRLGVVGISQAPPGSPEAVRVSAWLRKLEKEHRFVLLEADADPDAQPTSWTRRVMRDVDERVLLADADTDARVRPGEMPEAGETVPESVRLVLLHPPGSEHPQGSAAWLAPRRLHAHHHVRRGDPADVARVARFLAGVPIGLVLGGGGVRGLSHLGVMRALSEAGVAVDMIGGTSIGAIIGVQFALGRSPERIRRETQQAFAGLVDYTLPAVALASGGKLGASLRAALGDRLFEDTWLPYFCVASNLTRAEVAVLDRGTLWRAVRASCGLPGVFPPVGIDGDLLVDGCLLNNLPVDVMAQRCAGPIIAVDATPTVDLEVKGWSGDAMSGFRHLANRINPLGTGTNLPGIARILQRACELSSVRAHRARLRDVNRGLLLTPAVGGIPTLDFSKSEQAVEAGYRAASEALPGWLAGAS